MMPSSPTSVCEITETRLRELHDRVVLVKSNQDHRNPPSAMRGWIEVIESSGSVPEVRVALEFPQMFASKAHHRSLALDSLAVAQLLQAGHDEALTITIDEELV
jgi:hypothetical protein